MIRIIQGHVLDALAAMPDESVDCVVTSPPYWGLRDYGIEPMIWDDPGGGGHGGEGMTDHIGEITVSIGAQVTNIKIEFYDNQTGVVSFPTDDIEDAIRRVKRKAVWVQALRNIIKVEDII